MDIANPELDRYRNTLVSLNTSDLNGDHATDLIASYGAILFNIPAAANRPPTVDAGPDRVLLNDHGTIFRPSASDPDEDVLTYDIRDAAGNSSRTYPNACFESVFRDGDNLVTVTVNDGHGHSATDSVVYTGGRHQRRVRPVRHGERHRQRRRGWQRYLRQRDRHLYRPRQRRRHLGHRRRVPLRVDSMVRRFRDHRSSRFCSECECLDEGGGDDSRQPARRKRARIAVCQPEQGRRLPATTGGERRHRQHARPGNDGACLAETPAHRQRNHRLLSQSDDRRVDEDRSGNVRRPAQ